MSMMVALGKAVVKAVKGTTKGLTGRSGALGSNAVEAVFGETGESLMAVLNQLIVESVKEMTRMAALGTLNLVDVTEAGTKAAIEAAGDAVTKTAKTAGEGVVQAAKATPELAKEGVTNVASVPGVVSENTVQGQTNIGDKVKSGILA